MQKQVYTLLLTLLMVNQILSYLVLLKYCVILRIQKPEAQCLVNLIFIIILDDCVQTSFCGHDALRP